MTRRLQDSVTAQAQARPDAIAITAQGGCLTYGELDARSNQLARLLRDAGCRPGDRISVLVPKSATAITCILGIYKAGCLFVPLDPSSPAPRLARILDSCESRCLLAAGPVERLLGELANPAMRPDLSTGWLDAAPAPAVIAPRFALRDVGGASDAPVDASPEEGAHILFTSGSTGTPKGVVITHTNVIRFVEWARGYFDMQPTDRVSSHSPLHFDLSTFDLFGAFAAGAELHLFPSAVNLLPHKVADFIRDSALTQWFSVPSVLNYLAKFDALAQGDFPALKRVLWCGEVLPTPALIYWMTRLPHATFTNLYGPTEATIASSYYTVPECPCDANAEIPIGLPCDGEQLLVLDESLRPVPPGEVGDLYIGGAGLSPGYWRDPEKTAAVFVPARFGSDSGDRLYRTGDRARIGSDGLVYFHGRADTQIKSRGYRIELGEIEAALHTIPGVQEAAVLGIPTGGFEGTLIACAYATLDEHALPPAVLRAQLGALLPGYMLPSRWIVVPRLPRNASGKIDRRLLREQFQTQAQAPVRASAQASVESNDACTA